MLSGYVLWLCRLSLKTIISLPVYLFFIENQPTLQLQLWPLRNPYRHLIFPNMASYFSNHTSLNISHIVLFIWLYFAGPLAALSEIGSGSGIIGSSAAASTTATATVISTTRPTLTPNTPNLHRQRCYSNYCPSGYKMNAVCRDGYCVCTGQGYNYETCLRKLFCCVLIIYTDKV